MFTLTAPAKITPHFRARIRSYDWVLFCLVAVAAIMFFWNLGARPLKNWDESIYAQISKEMLRSGGWLTLHWDSQPWFEKPPLYMWVTTLFFKLFGGNEFSARLPSAISGIGLVATTYLLARQMYGKAVAIVGGLIALTAFQIVQASRLVTLDIMMTFFVFLAFYFYVRAADGNSKWWYLVATAAAVALMTKGVAGIVAPTAIGLAVLFDGQFKSTVREKHFWLAWTLAVAMVAPWHIAMYVLYGRAFTDEYFGYHVVLRAFSAIEGHRQDYFYYFGEFVEKFKPWWVLAPFAIVLSAVENIAAKRSRSWILVLISVLVFGVYTLARTKVGWYLTPVYPAMSILIAHLLVRIYGLRNYLKPIVVGFCVLGCLFAIGKLRQPYEKTDPLDTPVKALSLSARRTDDTDLASLIVLDADKHAALFYSDRPIQQATTRETVPNPNAAKRYVDFKFLADVTDHSQRRILLERVNLPLLAADYDITVVEKADAWVYALIKKRESAVKK